ncbi:MAG TPA: amidohydrolase [Chthonomonadaceae bacterium]|nr:amidohydrolase [Chthonomonadaceae bacterium]
MATPLTEMKRLIVQAVDRHAVLWKELALKIHAHPEIGLAEEKASQWLCEALAKAGFAVERGVADLPTAFVASHGEIEARPAVAFLAEYDALPELGHACSHNLICTAACLAATALAETIGPEQARVCVIGCPAEESYGGKAQLVAHGIFKGIDIALMAHGYRMHLPARPASGRKSLIFEFYGKSAHAAAAPHKGINALDAMIQTFVGISLLRQQLRGDDRVHGIITHGGKAPNIIPDYTRAEFMVRAMDIGRLNELEQRVLACARGAAEATGAQLKVSSGGLDMLPIRHNRTLEGLYADNLRFLGEELGTVPADQGAGSTDFGNVSQVVPAAHGYFQITTTAQAHTPEFAEVARSEAGLAGMVTAAKALALTALDSIEDPALLEKARSEFQAVG